MRLVRIPWPRVCPPHTTSPAPGPRGGDHPDHLAPGHTHHRAVIVLGHKLVQSKVELAPWAGAPAAAPAAPTPRAAGEAGSGSAPRYLLVHRAQVQREAAPASRAQLKLTGLAGADLLVAVDAGLVAPL